VKPRVENEPGIWKNIVAIIEEEISFCEEEIN